MAYFRLESNRNKGLFRSCWMGTGLLAVGTAIGIRATVYFTNHSNKLLNETIQNQSNEISILCEKDRSKTAEIASLIHDNNTLHHDNQALWREHGRVLAIRKGNYSVALNHPEGVSQAASIMAFAAPQTENLEPAKEAKAKKKGFFSWFR